MPGFWIGVLAALFVIVIALLLLVVATLGELGGLRAATGNRRVSPQLRVPEAYEVGPSIGAALPDESLITMNGHGTLRIRESGRGRHTLIVFLSPVCESCQGAVGTLNSLAAAESQGLHIVAVMPGAEGACRAFLELFPLEVPAVCDSDRLISATFDVNVSPFALLYDQEGVLAGKANLAEIQRSLPELLERSAYGRPTDKWTAGSHIR